MFQIFLREISGFRVFLIHVIRCSDVCIGFLFHRLYGFLVDMFLDCDFSDRRSTKTTERDRCNHPPHGFQHELFVKRILNQVPQVHLLFPYYQEVKILIIVDEVRPRFNLAYN